MVDKDEPARFTLKLSETNTVEQFYKRHMSSDNPIPQVIVVGILRVLLTTCPNAARNSGISLFSHFNIGGIDLHSEWSSCLSFLLQNKRFFLEHNFKSVYFSVDFI